MTADLIHALLPSDWPATLGDLPATAVESIGIVEYDGAYSTEYFGSKQDSSIFRPIIKIVYRSASYETASGWAKRAKEILHRYHDDTLLSVLLIGDILYLGRNNQKMHEFQTTFQIQVKE